MILDVRMFGLASELLAPAISPAPARRTAAASRRCRPSSAPRLAQIDAVGLPISGSSNVPTRTMIRFGRGSASLKTAVPQSGQKLRCITEPLSAVEV